MLTAGAVAAKLTPRDRGKPLTEQRAEEEAAAAQAQSKRARELQPAQADRCQSDRPAGARKLGRGRAARNAPLLLSGGVQSIEDRKASLMAAAEYRPMHRCTAVGPAGSGKLDEMPDSDDFALGTATAG